MQQHSQVHVQHRSETVQLFNDLFEVNNSQARVTHVHFLVFVEIRDGEYLIKWYLFGNYSFIMGGRFHLQDPIRRSLDAVGIR